MATADSTALSEGETRPESFQSSTNETTAPKPDDPAGQLLHAVLLSTSALKALGNVPYQHMAPVHVEGLLDAVSLIAERLESVACDLELYL